MLSAMKMHVLQKIENGFFGGPFCNDFEYTYSNTSYRVRIEQLGVRKLWISTDTVVKVDELLDMMMFIEQLLFILDGRFYPIEKLEIIDENENPEIYKKQIDNYIKNRLPIYSSIDICRYSFMKLINYNEVDFEIIIQKWSSICNELEIAFPMLLYCLSDVHMPVDCKIASIIEIAKPIGEILERKYKNLNFKRNRSGNLELRSTLKILIENFGTEIFNKECTNDYIEILDLFVNTRNKISHAKSLQNKKCLNGCECVLYIAKLSIMYRKIFFLLLEIDESLFADNISNAIKQLDGWYFDN